MYWDFSILVHCNFQTENVNARNGYEIAIFRTAGQLPYLLGLPRLIWPNYGWGNDVWNVSIVRSSFLRGYSHRDPSHGLVNDHGWFPSLNTFVNLDSRKLREAMRQAENLAFRDGWIICLCRFDSRLAAFVFIDWTLWLRRARSTFARYGCRQSIDRSITTDWLAIRFADR